ncbi:MAG: acetylxylan esterase [Candidatus Hydrogenedentes bacterium]|nr:acetylxylan esterase [Candidatus Hydrogenedentota bacterium]
MLAILLAGFAFAVEKPDVIWMDKLDAKERGVAVPEGTYAVWVWADDDKPATISIGGQTLTAAAKPKKDKKPGYAWINAGNLSITAGQPNLILGPTVASFALSTRPGFDPAKAMPDMRVLDRPDAVRDERALTVKHTDTVFTMPVYPELPKWETTAERLRRRTLVANGLLPMPEKTPLNAKITDRVTHDDYTVEKVSFEARPGFLVTGNLYRPVGKGPFPGVVCPHGHWEHGRLENTDVCSVPGRCITFARMGIVAFSYDMVGYNDSLQISHALNDDKDKLWAVHLFSLQLWDSIRAVDFIQSLPEVDPARIGCTGASGGGTQTFALTAVDPRIKVSAPVNMISSRMQGGCLCENAPILRMDNSNMEIGALMAPRPMIMVCATGDWTRETLRVEYPAIRSIYALYQKTECVDVHLVNAGHNYNKESREAVYQFFGKWLLGEEERYKNFSEPPFTVEPEAALRVFPDKKAPEGYPGKDQVIAQTIEANRAKWDAILPKTEGDAAQFRTIYGAALADVLGATVPRPNDIAPERKGYEERDGYVVERWILRRPAAGDSIPAILYRGRNIPVQDAVLIVPGDGKAGLADVENGGPGPLVKGLIEQGHAVMTMDAFLIGEHHSATERTVRVSEGRFMDTFQPTDTAYRVQDVLTAAAYLKNRRDLTGVVTVLGLGQGGMWSLLAASLDPGIGKALVDANQFKNNDDQAWVETYYVPSIRSIGDVATAAALMAPRPLYLFNTGAAFDVSRMRRAYDAVKAATLTVEPGPLAPDTIAGFIKG